MRFQADKRIAWQQAVEYKGKTAKQTTSKLYLNTVLDWQWVSGEQSRQRFKKKKKKTQNHNRQEGIK